MTNEKNYESFDRYDNSFGRNQGLLMNYEYVEFLFKYIERVSLFHYVLIFNAIIFKKYVYEPCWGNPFQTKNASFQLGLFVLFWLVLTKPYFYKSSAYGIQ